MKAKLSMVAAALAAVLMLAACGSMKQTASNSAAYTSGQNVGNALHSLYTQYKTVGKIDMSNAATLLNIASIASSYNTVKANLKDKSFYGDFAGGIIKGSLGMISTSTVDKVISTIGSTDLSEVTNAVNNNTNKVANTANNVASSFNTLMSLFGGK